MSILKNPEEIKECKFCGKEFLATTSNQKYCSYTCSAQMRSIQMRFSKQNQGVSAGAVGSTRECPLCGRKFKVKSKNQKYCSAECLDTRKLVYTKKHAESLLNERKRANPRIAKKLLEMGL